MKQFALFIICSVIFASCEKAEEKPSLVGSWRTTHQDFKLTVDEANSPELLEWLKKEKEQESSVEVPEAESYRLTFEEGGTGYGSGYRDGENSRYEFDFAWLSSDRLKITGTRFSKDGGVFFIHGGAMSKWTDWTIEELSTDKMVLQCSYYAISTISESYSEWKETYTYHYIFEKSK